MLEDSVKERFMDRPPPAESSRPRRYGSWLLAVVIFVVVVVFVTLVILFA
jgi:t-SNARE complex subunit (syntaxin)